MAKKIQLQIQVKKSLQKVQPLLVAVVAVAQLAKV